MGGASSTEMGQLFQPLAVLSHHLHCYNNGLRTRKAPSHNDGLVTPHYTISLTATAEEPPQHRDVGTAPHTLQWLVRSTSTHSPQVGRATAAVQLWSSPATWTSVYIRAHSPPFLQHTASQHRPAPPSHQLLGGCSGDTCVTQACSVSSSVF